MIENATNFYQKLEKERSDLVKHSITFWALHEIKIFGWWWVRKLVAFSTVFQLSIKRTLTPPIISGIKSQSCFRKYELYGIKNTKNT